ncbi:MAG: D-aminoacylase [Acidobacteria bacterium]|nr:D-aminoacylase [Acidobacteriota bacterium]
MAGRRGAGALLRAGLLVPLLAAGADYDLLIRNARVLDGTGGPWRRADVGLRSGRIAAIGRLEGASARRRIDAAGRILAPGFIDVHTHIEAGIEHVPGADNFVLDGVTTVVTGNCGSSEVYLAGWFGRLEARGLGVNVASLIGHNSLRRHATGSDERSTTPGELARMRELVMQGMRDGALGLSTGLAYVPGSFATTAEVTALAQAAADYGGIYATHMRDEGARIREAIAEAIAIGREAGLPVQISHLKIDHQRYWGQSGDVIGLIEKAREEGLEVGVDQHPYARASAGLSVLTPGWALAGGLEKLRERLSDSALAARIRREMAQRLRDGGHSDYSHATVARFPPQPAYEGRTISEITELRTRSATLEAQVQTVLFLLVNGDAQTIYESMSEEDVERILRYPHTVVASDGGIREFGVGVPHPRAYGARARVLSRFVRQRPALSLSEAVRRMTFLPAQRYRLRDRGLVREGMAADLVLFDPERVRERASYQQPHQYAEGFDWVLVNGVPVVEEGRLTGQRPGRILRGGGTRAALIQIAGVGRFFGPARRP